MAVKRHSEKSLKHILRQFSIADGAYIFEPMLSGLINDTYLVSTENNPLFILQRINHAVFENVAGLMRNLEKALKHLHSETYTQLQVLKTKEGNSYYSSQEEPIAHWRLVGFLEFTCTYDTAPNESVAFEAGKIIGAFHALLENSAPNDYEAIIPDFHSLTYREEQFQMALNTADSDQLENAKNTINFAKETISLLKANQIDELPIRVCHNDTKLNNILFSRKTNKALCLIDLDTVMAGHFLFDFGDAVRTIVNTAAEDEQNHSKITFESALFEAFVMGLASNGPILSDKEIQSLPSGVVLMPFLHGLRALTDYLENNRYYKVSYENQNLDRALSLFAFTKKALSELDGVKNIIATHLPFRS